MNPKIEETVLKGPSAILDPILKIIDRWPGTVAATALVGYLSVTGCAQTTASPFTDRKVDMEELQMESNKYFSLVDSQINELLESARRLAAEAEVKQALVEDAAATINQKTEKRNAFVASLSELAGQIPYGNLIFPIALGGLGLDNVRKEIKIVRQRRELSSAGS